MATLTSLRVDLQLATTKFERGIKTVSGKLKGLGGESKMLSGHLRAMFGIGAAAGFGAAIKSSLNYQNSLIDLSDRLGVTVEGLSRLHHAAQLSGVSQEAMNMGLQRMTRRVAEAAQGTGEAVKALDELGISAQRLKQLSPDEQFKILADALHGVEDPADRVRIAMKLFDSEGVKLLQTMTEGSEGLLKMGAAADAAGATVSEKAARAARDANAAFVQMGAASTGLANTLAVQLGPTLAEIAKWLSGAIPKAIEFTKDAFKLLAAGVVGTVDLIVSGLIEFYELLGNLPGGLGQTYADTAERLRGFSADLQGTQNAIFGSMSAASGAMDEFKVKTEQAQFALANFKLVSGETNDIKGAEKEKKKTDKEEQDKLKAAEKRQADHMNTLATINANGNKKIAAISKAAALVQALVKGKAAIAEAWASAPFPANLGAVAITTASTMANVAGIRSVGGIAHGGLDNVPKESTYLLDKGERVLSPNQNKDLTGFLKNGSNSAPVINIHNHTGSSVEQRQNGSQIDIIIGRVKAAISDDVGRGTGVSIAMQNAFGLQRAGTV